MTLLARTVTAHWRITVAGPLSAAASGSIRGQYDHVVFSAQPGDGHTVLDLDNLDQPALRGLLTLLWDFGHDVVAVSNQTEERMS